MSNLGQYFTPINLVNACLTLKQNQGTVLEPSAGSGAFSSQLDNCTAIEIDPKYTDTPMDFFDYSISHKYDTIIGNPPFVKHNDISPMTRAKLDYSLFDKRSNLYLFFIEKCLKHLNNGGELIFITPREFIKSTSAVKLNELLYATGSFTHFYDLGDRQFFEGASPNIAVWRWVKGRTNRKMETNGHFNCRNGQIWFGDIGNGILGDHFEVKVGAISACDEVFQNDEFGNVDMMSSTGQSRRMIYQLKHPYLEKYKDRLLQRKIRKFDENNWWEWGRKYCHREGSRIYVNCKTRKSNPFFVSDVIAFDMSVLALFPKCDIDLEKAANALNSTNWEELGFVTGGRLLFNQRSLENAPVDLSEKSIMK